MFDAGELAEWIVRRLLVFGAACAIGGYVVVKVVAWLWSHINVSWN